MTDVDTSLGQQFGAQDPSVTSMEAAMTADGVSPTDSVQQEYWGTDETYQVFLPDGVTYVECKYLTEGDRVRYQSTVQKDVRLQKTTGDAFLHMPTGEERHALLEAAIEGWNIIRSGKPVAFNKGSKGSNLEQWLSKAPPAIIDLIEKEIRLHEPWITGDVTVEQIDKQIEELQAVRAVKLKEEAGNGN